MEQLAGIPLAQLARVFGPLGATLHRQALGIDESPVRPPEAKPFVLEEETLAEDTNDDAKLLSVLYGLTERACRELRARGVVARTAWLHVRYSDGMDATRRLRFGRPSSVDFALFRMLEPLFLEDQFPPAARAEPGAHAHGPVRSAAPARSVRFPPGIREGGEPGQGARRAAGKVRQRVRAVRTSRVKKICHGRSRINTEGKWETEIDSANEFIVIDQHVSEDGSQVGSDPVM